MKYFKFSNDTINGIIIQEIIPFFDDERNDSDSLICQIGNLGTSITRINREKIYSKKSIIELIEKL